MTGSVPSARKYTYGVIIVGVVGVALIALFVWLAGQRIDRLGYADLESHARRKAKVLRGLVVDAWARARLDIGDGAWMQSGYGPEHPEPWRLAGARLPVDALGFSDLAGLVVHDRHGRVLWRQGDRALDDRPRVPLARGQELGVVRQDGAWLALGFRFPAGAEDGAHAVVTAYLNVGRPLDGGEGLVRFLTFGLVALGVTIYVLSAVTILLNRAQTRLINQEREKGLRLRAIGDVAGGIAHEVRNPLNAISLSIQYMQKLAERGDHASRDRDFARIHLELGKIRKVVDSFVKFARTGDMVVGLIDAGSVMEEALARFAMDLDIRGIRSDLAVEGDLTCTGDHEKILEVFAAVLGNALDSMRNLEAGELRVRVVGQPRFVRATVRDTGEITDETALTNIFEPRFSNRDTAMGLGMTVARTYVESHGGTIEAALHRDGGCVVTIELPRKGV